jgi:hypothetical protein
MLEIVMQIANAGHWPAFAWPQPERPRRSTLFDFPRGGVYCCDERYPRRSPTPEITMSSIRTLSVSLLLVAGLAACSKSPAGDASTAAPGADAITGIADCDEFLHAYEQCLADKIPAEARAQMQSGIAQWKSAWKTMAENAATRDSLPGVCRQTREASAPALKAYGCAL